MKISTKFEEFHIRLLVACTILTSITTQILMQTGGGQREAQFDLTEAFQPFFDEFIFTGLPPFISSGGVFSPEIHVFQIGFSLTGILILCLVLRLHGENGILPIDGSLTRKFAVGSGCIVGSSIMGIVHFSFIEEPLIHAYIAGIIFSGSLAWLGSVHLSCGDLEDKQTAFGISSLVMRTWSLRIGIFCWISMPIPLFFMQLEIAAFLEWVMMLSLQTGLLSLEPLLKR